MMQVEDFKGFPQMVEVSRFHCEDGGWNNTYMRSGVKVQVDFRFDDGNSNQESSDGNGNSRPQKSCAEQCAEYRNNATAKDSILCLLAFLLRVRGYENGRFSGRKTVVSAAETVVLAAETFVSAAETAVSVAETRFSGRNGRFGGPNLRFGLRNGRFGFRKGTKKNGRKRM